MESFFENPSELIEKVLMPPHKTEHVDVKFQQQDAHIEYIEKELDTIRKSDLPNIYGRLNRLDIKTTIALCLFGIHLALLVYGLNQMKENQKALVEISYKVGEQQLIKK